MAHTNKEILTRIKHLEDALEEIKRIMKQREARTKRGIIHALKRFSMFYNIRSGVSTKQKKTKSSPAKGRR